MKKKLLIGLMILIVPVLGLFIVARIFYPDNVAETASDGGRKDLKTRIYKTDIESAEKTVREIIPTLSTYGGNWKLADAGTRTNNQTVIKAEVPVVIFTDDLYVTLQQADAENAVRVEVRSSSRVGKSDFGENARHVRKILEALDKKLAN